MSRLLENAKHDLGVLRNQRAKLFKAFDIYKSNVEYGVIEETQETHDLITTWYLACLDLDYQAINNPPSEIVRYL